MRQVTLPPPARSAGQQAFNEWVNACLREIELASQEDIALMAKEFTVTGHTPTRVLDAATATATDVADVLCTLLEDLQKRGSKRRD